MCSIVSVFDVKMMIGWSYLYHMPRSGDSAADA